MLNYFSWKKQNKVFNFYKLVDPSYSQIENLSSDFKIDIDVLMESYDLEQYPYIQDFKDRSLSVILDVPLLNDDINLFSVPMHFILKKNNIILILKKSSQELEEIDNLVEEEQSIEDVFFSILFYISNLYLLKLKKIKKRLDYIMNQVYEKNNFHSKFENEVQKMRVELIHYMSSLETNIMVIKQIKEIMKNNLNSEFHSMYINSIQAYDISKLYITLNQNLFEYFTLHQDKVVSKKINRLTALTISLTIPNMVFGFYGMNVNLPYSSIEQAWFYITISVIIIAFIIYKLTKFDR